MLIGCALVAALQVPVAAQSATVQADALFREARALMTEKKYVEACAKFEASHKLSPAPTTLFSLSVCRELEGKLATAWGLFLEIERQYRSSSDEIAKELIKNALDRASKLEPRLSKLVIVVNADSRASGLEVRRDDTVVDPAVWGQALPLDGGAYEVTARLPGADVWTTKIVIKPERDVQTVSIPKLAASRPVPVEVPPERVAEPRSRRVPILVAAGAVVLGGGALGFELWGRSQHDDAQAAADANDRPRALDLQDSANTKRYLAQGLGIAAIAVAGVSIVLFARGGGDEPSAAQARRIQLVPTASSDRAGVSLMGAW
jgi:hypothetical protein